MIFFAQVVPWIEVLLHTLIDWMRTEEAEGESRKVNHSLFGVSLFVRGLSVVGLLYDISVFFVDFTFPEDL